MTLLALGFPTIHLVVRLAIEDSEDGEEEVDDVEVKTDGRSNLLLDMIMSHNKLCVHQDIAREYKCHNARVYKLNRAVCREEPSHESKQD